MLAKKIITLKDLRVTNARKSSVMKDFVAKGGGDIIRKAIGKKEFLGALRAESKSHAVGDKGFTKKGLTNFLGGLLNNKKDHLTDRKVKKLADLYEIKCGKVFNAAAEIRAEQHRNESHEQNSTQLHQQEQVEIRNHISEIITKGKEKARANLGGSSVNSNQNEIRKTYSGDVLNKFKTSNKNFRTASDSKLLHLVPPHIEQTEHADKSQSFGHLSYLKNSQHDFVTEEKTDAEKIKERLARIQGKTDNERSHEEKLAA